MKKETIKKSGMSKSKVLLTGASLAAVAAGAYFFLGPKGKKNQKETKAWAMKMKKDVIKKLKETKEANEPAYNKIIDAVGKDYMTALNLGQAEVDELKKDLKKHWKTISKSVNTVKKEVKKNSKK